MDQMKKAKKMTSNANLIENKAHPNKNQKPKNKRYFQ